MAERAKSSNRGSKPGERRGGRQRGTPNKVTGALKDMILQSLANVGGVAYLSKCARDPKTRGAYLQLVGKVLPLQLKDGGRDPVVPAPVIHEHIK